ncbi:3-oxoacyl-[acyl-carrier-protein] synthase 2 [Alicyclobacillus contaminans]|uniref:beta-ketoacyl-[acyl-carrier-protein] synthase family protein n=1 Tax=Alicyclobacillus contaminans TaxID=392016 RepID=UPI000429865B|nr:beta-ketoacyl-[acyl-carrier-protein] synthase family protein [Alicyclobacillus contaminans]GMA51476.1 3-oxoacyl-[acyl-carrier-protein] synthase 2 [Alicyclobacillus contaminans]
MSRLHRVVVTGLGAVTPFGTGTSRFWDALLAGQSAVGETTNPKWREYTPVMAEAKTFDASSVLPRKLVKDTDRFTQMALVAAMEAVADAGLDAVEGNPLCPNLPRDELGVSLGSAFGGVQSLEEGMVRIATGTSSRVGARMISKSIPNAAAAALAMRYQLRGPVMTYATACASSANAIGEAMHWLQTGEVQVVLAGGAECLFTPGILAGLRSAGALAQSGPEDWSAWSRPFAADRQGMVMGEGAAILVLETLEHAKARGARIYAELIGYGASNDAYHETSPHPSGEGAALAMRRALRRAGLEPADIDYINAHATATPAGDAAESAALATVFGQHLQNIPVSSIKGAVGHMLGAAGAIESIACVQALATGWLPPTLHCHPADPAAPPDLVPHRGRPQAIRTALSNSFGFGGQNGVLIWRRPEL